MGFLLPPLLVQKGEGVEQQLYILFISVAVLCSVLLVLILICRFRNYTYFGTETVPRNF